MDENLDYQNTVALYEASYGESDHDLLAERLGEVIARLDTITSAQPGNADANQLLGLCWYELPSVSADTQRRAEDAFRRALAIDPDHQYANLFLGHLLFDTRRYQEASELFARVDPAYFCARSQQWRLVKNDELRLCCRLMTGTASVVPQDVETICERYETDPEVEFIVPREIVLCVDELIRRDALAGEIAREYSRRVLSMLERTDNMSVRYLEEPVARLQKAAVA